MSEGRRKIALSVERGDDRVRVSFGADQIDLSASMRNDGKAPISSDDDFAVWLVLPLAMRVGCEIEVRGAVSDETRANAARLAEVWRRWLPSHFRPVSVTSAGRRELASNTGVDGCFYSGGVDSTYALLKRMEDGTRQRLITVRGMDYPLKADAGFERFLEKTDPFSRAAGEDRVVVETNANAVYLQRNINPPKSPIGHAFLLSAVGLLYSPQSSVLGLAADFRRDEEFIAFPYGSSTVTDRLIDTGDTRLQTEAVDLTRTEKLGYVTRSEDAMRSLSFCGNKASRPENCGVCEKCVRSKIMFVAATGEVPPIFSERSVPERWAAKFKVDRPLTRAFLADILLTAERRGTIGQIPNVPEAWSILRATCPAAPLDFRRRVQTLAKAVLPNRRRAKRR